MYKIDFKSIKSLEDLFNLKNDLQEKGQNPMFMNQIVPLSDVNYLIKLSVDLYMDKVTEIEFKKDLYSKLDGKKEQKRGKDSLDYVIKSFKANVEDTSKGTYIVEWQTPYTLNKLQIKPNILKNKIIENLKELTKDIGFKVISIKLVNNIFYVVTSTDKNYLEDESLLKYFQQF